MSSENTHRSGNGANSVVLIYPNAVNPVMELANIPMPESAEGKIALQKQIQEALQQEGQWLEQVGLSLKGMEVILNLLLADEGAKAYLIAQEQFNKANNYLQQAMEQIKAKIAEYSAYFSSFNSDMLENERSIDTTITALIRQARTNTDAKLEALGNEIAQGLEQLKNLITSEATSKTQELQTDIRQKAEALNNLIEAQKEVISNMQKDFIKKASASLGTEFGKLEAKLNKKASISELDSLNIAIHTELNNLKETTQTLTQTDTALKGEIDTLKNTTLTKSWWTPQYETLKEFFNQYFVFKKETQDFIQTTTNTITQITNDANETADWIHTATTILTKLRSNKAAKSELDSVNNTLTTKINELERDKATTSALENAKSQLESQINTNSQKAQELETKLQDYEIKNTRLYYIPIAGRGDRANIDRMDYFRKVATIDNLNIEAGKDYLLEFMCPLQYCKCAHRDDIPGEIACALFDSANEGVNLNAIAQSARGCFDDDIYFKWEDYQAVPIVWYWACISKASERSPDVNYNHLGIYARGILSIALYQWKWYGNDSDRFKNVVFEGGKNYGNTLQDAMNQGSRGTFKVTELALKNP